MCVRLQLVTLFDKSSFIREWYLVNDKPLVPKSILLLLHLVSESPALCPWCLGEIGITKSWNFERLCFETRPPLKCLWSQILVLFDVLPLGWTQNVNTQKWKEKKQTPSSHFNRFFLWQHHQVQLFVIAGHFPGWPASPALSISSLWSSSPCSGMFQGIFPWFF